MAVHNNVLHVIFIFLDDIFLCKLLTMFRSIVELFEGTQHHIGPTNFNQSWLRVKNFGGMIKTIVGRPIRVVPQILLYV